MRTLSLALSLFVGLTSLSCGALSAQSLVSQDQAQRAGMVVNWFSQARGAGTSGLVNTALVIDEDKGATYFEVKGGRLREVISENGIGPDGERFKDQAAAEQFANIRLEVIQKRLEFEGSSDKASVSKITIPKSTIYAMSQSGLVQAFDAETGRQLWQTEVGERSFPSSGVGASKKLVAAVNGSSVYCLEPETGKVLWKKRCETAVMGNPAATDDSIFVPLADGRMQIFDATTDGNRTQTMISKGASFNPPTVAGTVVAWGTDKGVLSVAPVDNMNRIMYRLKADSAIDAPATSKGNLMFVASHDGFLYAFNKIRGAMIWSSSIGEHCSRSPYPIGDYLFVVTEENHLFKFDSRNGVTAPGWEKHINGIKQVIGASKDRLYVQTTSEQIQVLDLSTGSKLGTIGGTSGLTPVVNYINDRIYLVNNSGVIECLRETGSISPFIHADEVSQVEFVTPKLETGKKFRPKNEDNDPFSDGVNPKKIEPADSDPFGDNKPSKTDSDDPFGGGGNSGGTKKPSTPPAGGKGNDDPFGGGGSGDKKNDDPFGGG
ncbi:MAG: PQQ-binding-like beta-propeller repeat protein [Planctomycetota bacterium]